ncbi:TRAP transporter small permease subunit [Mangrovitalea sediminis]|uniref:TRAP transporter small permease subunit n=1 Tax=Mangrovitalea sediminis TaxID=1982043 RepID=UPI0018E9245A|nr:TRAP transporter small permease [Mangrovitalea sediminis]
MIISVIAGLRRINRFIALLVGLALIACVALILIDISLRQLGISFGGSDEISGYVMAGIASWGVSYTLTELAHVRIDLIRVRLRPLGKAILDLIAIVALAGTAIVIAFEAWPVLQKTIAHHALANTSLATPLWIPQSIWFAGWVWFALSSSLLVLLTVVLMMKGDLRQADSLVGARTEMELEL